MAAAPARSDVCGRRHRRRRRHFVALLCIACDDARPRRRTTQGLSRALGVPLDDTKEVVGAWIAPTERAAVWHRVCREWQGRRVTDITLVLTDGLTGRPDARQTVVPHPVVHRASRAPASARWVVDRADARRSHDAGGCSGADRSRRASRFAAPCRALRLVRSASVTRPTPPSGSATGSASRRPSRTRRRSVACSPPRRRSNASTCTFAP